MNLQQPVDLKTALRQMRIIHFMMIAAALMQLYVLYQLRHAPQVKPQPVSSEPTFAYVLVLFGIIEASVLLFVRKTFMDKAVAMLTQNPTDFTGIQRWRGAVILGSSGVYALFLIGWVLCFFRTPATWTYLLLWSLYAIGFFLLIPKMPIDEMSANNPQP